MADLSTSALKSFRGGGRLVAAILLFAVLVAGVWLERVALLQGAADVWTVSDPVTRSEVVVILGGSVDIRPFVAAELYKNSLVGKVLISQVVETRSSNLLAIPGHSETNRMVLQKL